MMVMQLWTGIQNHPSHEPGSLLVQSNVSLDITDYLSISTSVHMQSDRLTILIIWHSGLLLAAIIANYAALNSA